MSAVRVTHGELGRSPRPGPALRRRGSVGRGLSSLCRERDTHAQTQELPGEPTAQTRPAPSSALPSGTGTGPGTGSCQPGLRTWVGACPAAGVQHCWEVPGLRRQRGGGLASCCPSCGALAAPEFALGSCSPPGPAPGSHCCRGLTFLPRGLPPGYQRIFGNIWTHLIVMAGIRV